MFSLKSCLSINKNFCLKPGCVKKITAGIGLIFRELFFEHKANIKQVREPVKLQKNLWINTKSKAAGVTLIELMVTMAILSILAAGILPLSQVTCKRTKELELKRNLRNIRTALDDYKRLSDEGKIPVEASGSGYPKNLEVLVEGVDLAGPVSLKRKFLRRIPGDPFTEDGVWGLRSYTDEQDSGTWGGQDVYDIYSKNDKQALDGSYYKKW